MSTFQFTVLCPVPKICKRRTLRRKSQADTSNFTIWERLLCVCSVQQKASHLYKKGHSFVHTCTKRSWKKTRPWIYIRPLFYDYMLANVVSSFMKIVNASCSSTAVLEFLSICFDLEHNLFKNVSRWVIFLWQTKIITIEQTKIQTIGYGLMALTIQKG